MMLVRGRIWLKLELMQAFGEVLITCRYKKDQIKKKRPKIIEDTNSFQLGYFIRGTRATDYVVGCPIWPNSSKILCIFSLP